MSGKLSSVVLSIFALGLTGSGCWHGFHSSAEPPPDRVKHVPGAKTKEAPLAKKGALDQQFVTKVQPFLATYCFSCHGSKKPKAQLDSSPDSTVKAIVKNIHRWEQVLERLEADEMPPRDAPRRPKADERTAIITWLRELRDHEARKNAGHPGIVLARRLSNAEYDYSIRDLTGVDIRPTREFPVDPANQAGFDNTGESLIMSSALLKKYLSAARHVADHVVLKPAGFVFAPHPVVAETDRDKYCVHRIIEFYKRHNVDYADYFQAAYSYRFRTELGRPDVTMRVLATEARLSTQYLEMIWSSLQEADVEAGPLAAVRKMWLDLPAPRAPSRNGVSGEKLTGNARIGCEKLREMVLRLRKQLKPDVKKPGVNGMSAGSQTFVLWRNRQFAGKHRSYTGDVFADLKKLAEKLSGTDIGLATLFEVKEPHAEKDRLRKALERFCSVFPETFVVTDRGPYFNPDQADKGRPLTAGFHLMQGYFRDDEPLCDLILDERQRRELDALWHELNFITLAPMRQYADFIFFERAEPPRYMLEAEFDFARSEDKDCASAAKISRLAKVFLAKAIKRGAKGDAVEAIETYFTTISADVRKVERDRISAEPSHLDALVKFAGHAYRRPMTKAEEGDTLAFYRKLRQKYELAHEDAIREAIVSVLMSPHFCYRFQRTDPGKAVQPLSSYELANRLSYFLWSSMPDAELLARAAQGDLHQPNVLIAQTRRMLRDQKVRGLATEFAGNWLDIRRFEEHNAVDRKRFPSFTNELRQAMFEEPIRYFVDLAQRNRSVLNLLHGKDTFVNRPLAKHYGMPALAPPSAREKDGGEGDWVYMEDADRYGRGGLLPMAVFLTKNAPGLRTSPVKRGYWVVRRLLGETIPPPPPTVPELPMDEAKLGDLTLPQLLARHRADKSCAGCHVRFDAIGLVYEDFGPIGERRTKNLGGRLVETAATFPDGKDRNGLPGLRAYLRDKRQDDFVDNLCKKLFSYALGRSLQLSDKLALDAMRTKLAADAYPLGGVVEAIVTSPQFLNKRGRGDVRDE